ncbi:MAG: hypothetical protein JEY94_13730 [Melioribacteraceae bacterium]|nr:hypothetical protein [Melioribacteraceae bacterium]
MKNWILSQIDFNCRANKKIIDVLKLNDIRPKRCIKLLSHLIAYQDMWYEKLKKHIEFNIAVWDTYTLVECEILNKQSWSHWQNLIKYKKRDALFENFTYRNSAGIPSEMMLIDITKNIFEHSAHHRGQIALLLKQNKIEPPDLSYFSFTNEDPVT